MIYKMQLSDSVDTMIFELLEVPIEGKDITGIADNTTIDGNVFRDYLWLKKQWTQRWSIMCQDEYERLRGFWTRQFGNAEVPLYRLFYGDNVYEDKNTFTVNGFVQIEDDAPLYSPLSLTHLYGNATQKTLSGKNLINTNALNHTLPYTYTSRGITFTIGTDGSITINGQNDGTNNSTLFLYNSTTPLTVVGGQYTGDINPSDGVYRATSFICYDGSAYRSFRQNAVLSLSAGNQQIYVQVAKGETTQFSNYKIYPMLEAGSTKSPYEPYVGSIDGALTPSPNPDYPQDVNVVSGAQTVKIIGKNLIESSTKSGNRVFLNGETADTDFVFPVGTYTVQYKNDSHTCSTYIRTASTSATSLGASKNITFTATEPFALWFYRSGMTEGEIYDIQLELGSTATTYEPYKAQSQEINLGKNLSDPNNANIINAYIRQAGITAEASNRLVYYKVEQNSYYTISATRVPVSGKESVVDNMQVALCSDVPANGVATYDIQQSASLYDTTLHASFTVYTGSHTYLAFKYANTTNTDASATLATIQLERGSKETSFSPYKTPIELAKIGTYQDYIWNNEGTWKIHKEVGKKIYNGSESWAEYSNNKSCFHATLADALVQTDASVVSPIYADYYGACSPTDAISQYVPYGISLDTATSQARIVNKDQDTNTDFKTWLSTHNTTVYYALATPTDTEITDSELIEQLNFVASLYEGVNNVMLIPSAGAQGEIGVKYRLNYEEETDIIPNTPVVLTLSDGGVINACGCRQNIQLIMRETTQGNSES